MPLKSILISAELKKSGESAGEALNELAGLAATAGMEPVAKMRVRIPFYNPSTLIGRGKLEEIRATAEKGRIEVAVFDNEISPVQERNIAKMLGIRIITRTKLILEIFAARARTREGKLQAELANLSYELTRLSGKGKSFSQQRGLIGTRGPGERDIEYKRRSLRDRIHSLKKEMESIRKERAIQHKKRASVPLPRIAISGYTNAGKSTILRLLAEKGNGIYADDKLFATLDPATKRVKLPGGGTALFSDTVGFIQKLPHALIAAFSSTLEEIISADIILLVHDISSPEMEKRNRVALKTIRELARKNRVPEPEIINVFNKTDKVSDPAKFRAKYAHMKPVLVSAAKGEGMRSLLEETERRLVRKWKPRRIKLPPGETAAIREIYASSLNVKAEFSSGNTVFTFLATDENYSRILSRISSNGR